MDWLREHQEGDEQLGAIFAALHTFADRTINRFFSDAPDMPHPTIGFGKVRSSCKGSYEPKSLMALEDHITIDPFKVTDGAQAAEVLAHELVHQWQHYIGRLPERNYHNAEFHNRLGTLGVISTGKRGHHDGYTENNVWEIWMHQNKDLKLAAFTLPGEQAGRQLLKWQCPVCGFSFRTRRTDVNVLCFMEECEEPMVEVPE